MEKCPACGNYSLVYDDYYGRSICLMRECGWSELSLDKKQIEKEAKLCLEEEPKSYVLTDESGIGLIITDPKKFE